MVSRPSWREVFWASIGGFLLPTGVKVVLSDWFKSEPLSYVVAFTFALTALLWIRESWGDKILHRVRYQWKASKWAGLTRVYPVAPYPDLGNRPFQEVIATASTLALEEVAQTADSIQLLLVSGWCFVGHEQTKGLLYDALAQRQAGFRLEVLLLDPASDAAKKRAESQGMTPDQYANGAQAVLWTLSHWRHRFDVRVALYGEEPIWQMVISPHEVWLLCAASNVPTGRSPVYCLRRRAEYGLSFGLLGVWDRRRGTAVDVDLASVAEPDWRNLKDSRMLKDA